MDGVYFLMFGGWRRELRANRWHYARRWARRRPVVLVQPEQAVLRYPPASVPEGRIAGCRMLPVKTARDPAKVVPAMLVQTGQVMADMVAQRIERPLLWFYNPYLAGLYAAVPAVARVCHATENYFDFDGLPALFLDQYRMALAISDLVVAVSDGVADAIRERCPGVPVEVVSNGCDYAAYSAGTPDRELIGAANGHERIAIYAGNINGRLDLELLTMAARRARSTFFAFFGPVTGLAGSDSAEWRALLSEPNVRHFGETDPDRLPDLYQAADVGLIPYRPTRLLVRNGFPLKALEMCATGLPVVSSPLRPLAGLAGKLVVTEDRPGFLAALDATSRRTLTPEAAEELRAVAARHDYDAKFATILDLLAARVPRSASLTTRLDAGLVGPLAESWRAFATRYWSRSRQSSSPVRVIRESTSAVVWWLYARVPASRRAGVPAAVRRAVRRCLGL